MTIECENFGVFIDGDEKKHVMQYTLSNSTGLIVKVISYGAGISDVVSSDKNGVADHVVFGFDTLQGWINSSYIGSTVGRFANRINGASFNLNGETVNLSKNFKQFHLHGGERGWDKFVWESEIRDDSVVFSLVRPDGDMGYPGATMAQVSYSLSNDGSLKIEHQAMSSKATAINMTSHPYFNLAGHGSGEKGLLEHDIQIHADNFLPVNSNFIPTGEIVPVESSSFDLRRITNFGTALSTAPAALYDHCFVTGDRGALKTIAKVTHPKSGRSLTVSTTEPGVQFYTGNYISKDPTDMIGRENTPYLYRGAFCLEPQNYPDAPNKKHFPSSILYPGDVYEHTIIYKFETTL